MDLINRRTNKAIQELELRVDAHSSIDKLEITKILVDYLDYPDLRKAQDHAIANTMGNYDIFQIRSRFAQDLSKNQQILDKSMVCECCGLFIHEKTIPYCTPLQNTNMGLGTRLYLNSLLYNATIFFLASALFTTYCIITNYIACKDSGMSNCRIQGISLSYKIKNPSQYDNTLYTASVLGIVLVSLWGIIDVIKNHRERKIQIQLTQKFIQASEFTLMLEKFPAYLLKQSSEENFKYIQNLFKEYGNKIQSQTNFTVTKVNVARNLYVEKVRNKQKAEALKEELKQKRDVFRNWIVQRKYHNRFFCTENQRLQKYEEYEDFYSIRYDVSESYIGGQDEFVILFVTFQESKAREEIEYNARSSNILNCFNLCHKKQFPIEGVVIKKAPPPEEIKWTNVGFPFKTKLLRIFLVYGVSLLLLAGSLAMTYGLNQVQNDNPDIWVSVLISIVITGINFAIEFVIMFLSKYLNEITETNIQFNIAFKICLFEVLNVIGVPLLALYISERGLYGDTGLAQDIFFIALFNILPPLGRFIDPYYIFINLRNKFYARPGNFFSKLDYRLWNFDSQEQFNKIYEANDFDLGYEYAYVIKTSIFTSFFLILQPVIALFAVIGLLLMFFVNKYRILYRFFKPRFYSATVNSLVNYLLNLSPMIFALGMLVFINWQKDHSFSGTYYLNWVIFIIGAFFFIFPFRILYKCIPEPKFPEWNYKQLRPTLPSEYDRMNPVTKSKALDEHINYFKMLEDTHQLPEQAILLKQSVLRATAIGDTRKSMMAGDDLRQTLRKSRALRSPEGSNISNLKDQAYGQNLDQKQVNNDNLQSYSHFAVSQRGKNQI